MVPLLGLPMLLSVLFIWFEVALGRYSPGVLADWSPSDGFDAVAAASRIPGDPNVWTDGSLVRDQVTGVSFSGAGFFSHQSQDCWGGRRWGHVDRVRLEGEVQFCRGFCSVFGPFSQYRRLTIWERFFMLGACWMVVEVPLSLELVTDGDVLLLIERMLHLILRFGLPRSKVMLMRIWRSGT